MGSSELLSTDTVKGRKKLGAKIAKEKKNEGGGNR